MLHPKYILLVGLALLALPVASDAYYRGGVPADEGVSPWMARSDLTADELRLSDDVSAAARIGESFALFAPAATVRDQEAARALTRAAKPRA
jgi:hypothetical protein